MTAYIDHKGLVNEVIDQACAQEATNGVHRVLDRVVSAESATGRAAGSAQLLVATKTHDVGKILAAINAGIHVIGENRLQEIIVKADDPAKQLGERGYSLGVIDTAEADTASATTATYVPFHLIDQLQANKIGEVLPVVDAIESVDSVKLAEETARHATMRGITIDMSLEVNESGEESKPSYAPSHITDLTQRIGTVGGLYLQGLMAVGVHVDDERTIRAGFAHLYRTRGQIFASSAEGAADCTELSAGMTHDTAYAIEEDSTIVRVGIVIFDERAFI